MKKIKKPELSWIEWWLLHSFINTLMYYVESNKHLKEKHMPFGSYTPDGWRKLKKVYECITTQVVAYMLRIYDKNVKFEETDS